VFVYEGKLRPYIYDAFMLDHAAGALPAGLHVAGDLHVSLCGRGADIADFWSIVGGAMLERDVIVAAPARKARRPNMPCASAARAILDTDLNSLSWRKGLGGARLARTGIASSHFMRLEAGAEVPHHSHSTLEATVVLKGELQIDGETYGEGEIAIGEPGEAHQPMVSGHEACVCFVARGSKPFWRLT